jgi:phage-related protein
MERLLADAQELTGVEYDISNLSDVYSAIHVIQEDLGITGTTAEEAATTFSGSLSSMKSAVTNLLGDIMIGNDISGDLSALQETVVTFFNNNFIPMLGNLVSSLPEIVTGLFQMAITEIGALTEGLPELFNFAAELFTNLAVAFVSNLPYLVASLYDLFVSAFNLLASMDIGQAVTDFLTLLQEEIEYNTWAIFNEDSSIVESVLNGIINASQMIISQGSQIVISLMDGILSMLPSLVETVSLLLNSMFAYIVEMLPFIMEWGMNILVSLIQGILDNLPAIIDAVFTMITTLLDTIVENLPEIIEAGFMIVTKLIIGLLNALPDLIASVLTLAANIIDLMFSTDWASIGVNIITGIIEGLKATVSALFDWLIDMAATALNKVKEFFGIASPSKVFRDEVGQWIPEGIAVGIEANAESVTDAMDALSSATLASYDVSALGTGNVTTSSATDDVRTLSEKIESLGETVGNAVSDAMSSGFDMTWNGRELGRLVKTYA